MARVVVYHSGYGCETGCCGHVVSVDDKDVGRFSFSHPDSNSEADRLAYARELVASELGEEHVADLDWENCQVHDD